MDVRQLSALVAIADHGTFSAAARALFTVQSNVSSHIARLERELGITLVDRAHGGLTDDGQRVVERARRILREIDEITADVAAVDGQVTGDVRIGILGTTARWLLPHLLTALDDRHPNVRAIVSEGSTSVLIPSLLAGRFSAAIIHLPVDDPELVIEPLFAEDLVLVAHAEPPAGRRAASCRSPRSPTHRLLLPPTGSALRRVLDRAAGDASACSCGRRPRSTACACSPAWPPTATARRSSRRPRCRRRPPAASPSSACPSCRRRVVALAHQRRPGAERADRAPCSRCCATSSSSRRAQQPGVRVGTDAVPAQPGV